VADAEPGSVYEIGCAPGLFLKRMEQAGWAAFGCEASGKDNVLWDGPVEEGLFPDVNGARLKVDLVCAFDVFEHLPDVKEALSVMVGMLNPGGRIMIQTPVVYDGVGMPARMWIPS